MTQLRLVFFRISLSDSLEINTSLYWFGLCYLIGFRNIMTLCCSFSSIREENNHVCATSSTVLEYQDKKALTFFPARISSSVLIPPLFVFLCSGNQFRPGQPPHRLRNRSPLSAGQQASQGPGRSFHVCLRCWVTGFYNYPRVFHQPPGKGSSVNAVVSRPGRQSLKWLRTIFQATSRREGQRVIVFKFSHAYSQILKMAHVFL